MTCAWIGCPDRPYARGICSRHYDKTLRAGRRAKRPQHPLDILIRHRYGTP